MATRGETHATYRLIIMKQCRFQDGAVPGQDEALLGGRGGAERERGDAGGELGSGAQGPGPIQ